jgi:hypothetical protein
VTGFLGLRSAPAQAITFQAYGPLQYGLREDAILVFDCRVNAPFRGSVEDAPTADRLRKQWESS